MSPFLQYMFICYVCIFYVNVFPMIMYDIMLVILAGTETAMVISTLMLPVAAIRHRVLVGNDVHIDSNLAYTTAAHLGKPRWTANVHNLPARSYW